MNSVLQMRRNRLKRILYSFLLTFLVLLLTKQLYVTETVHLSFEAKSNRHINVIAFYTEETEKERIDWKVSNTFDIDRNHTVYFNLPAKKITRLKLALEFPHLYVWSGPLSIEGTETITVPATEFLNQEETFGRGTFQKIHKKKPFAVLFDQDVKISGRPKIYFSVMAAIAAASFVLSYLIVTFKTAALLAAATAGYKGIAISYSLGLSSADPFSGVAITVLLFLLYRKTYGNTAGKINFPLALLSTAFGLINLMALSLHRLGSWYFLVQNPLISLICVAGTGFLFYTAGLYFFNLLSSGILLNQKTYTAAVSKFLDFYRRHTMLSAFIIILLLWLPWHIIFYPGYVTVDTRGQLKEALGLREATQHHPYLSTLLMGTFFKTGLYFKNGLLGLYLYVLAQTLFCAYIFALSIDYMKKRGLSGTVQLAALFFFGVVPVGYYSIWQVKDVLYSGVITLFVIQTLILLDNPQKTTGFKSLAAYAATALLASLLRNNGIYVVIPTMLVLLLFFCRGSGRLKTGLSAAFVICLFLFLTKSVFPALGFPEGSRREALSVPFQQTARYIKNHNSELTEQEKEVINRILDLKNLGTLYKPHLSDPVKRTYKLTGHPDESEYLADYFKTWFKMFLKHPVTYAQATMANSFSYYAFTPYTIPFFPEREIDSFDYDLYTNMTKPTLPLRTFLRTSYKCILSVAPYIYILYGCAFYTWLFLLFAVYFFRRKDKKALLALIPSFMVVLICIASPANGLFRYYMPAVMSLPALFAFLAARAGNRKENEGKTGG